MNRKELKRQYVQTVPPMGVYQVRNKANGKVFVDSGLNLNGKINRCKFQLNHGSHVNKNLQADFNALGEERFEFEILDVLDPEEEAKTDHSKDLKLLEDMWVEKLQPYGEKGYHRKK